MRAAGLQGDASPEIIEIIEIIDDDTDTFGQRAPTLTTHDTGGRRWIGPVATAILVGLIGYGVATSASSVGKPKAAPVTSTSEVATTAAPVPFTVPPPPVPYYAADPPAGYTVRYAEMQMQQGSVDFGGGLYELWAAPGATVNSGSWFSIETSPGGGLFAQDGYRIMAGDRIVAVSHTVEGQTSMQFNADGIVGVNITAFGWDDEQLARLAQSISTTGGSLTFIDDWFTATHQKMSTVRPWMALQGLTLEIVSYASAGDGPSFSLSVAPNSPVNPGELQLDRAAALRFYLDDVTPFEVDGHSATAGLLAGADGQSLATWIDGDNIIVAGMVPASSSVSVQEAGTTSEIIAFARTVHQVSSQTWDVIRHQADASVGPEDGGFDGGFGGSNPLPVSSGTDAENRPWTIQVILGTERNTAQVLWQSDTTGWMQPAAVTAKISTFFDDQRTYVVAELPRAIAATAELHVLRDGLDAVTVPFNDADPTADRTFGAYAFSEPIRFTAQIVGPDGAVLATWPSP